MMALMAEEPDVLNCTSPDTSAGVATPPAASITSRSRPSSL
jgi:hypothetical protein